MSSPHYVYAIVRREAPLPSRIGAEPFDELARVPWRELAAVTRCMAAPSSDLTMEAVLQHELVVEAVRAMGPALPVRFGTVFSDARSVASALADRYAPLEADLDRLGNKAEMSLTALWSGMRGVGCGVPSVEPGARGAGAHYLRTRAAELQRDDELKEKARAGAEKVNDVLSGLAVEARVSLVPTPRIALRVSYLIDPARARDFQAAFDAARLEQPEFRMLLTGPWPPYSFATTPTPGLARLLTDALQERRG